MDGSQTNVPRASTVFAGALQVIEKETNEGGIKIFDPNWEFLGYKPQDNAEDHREMLRGMGVDVDGPWEWPEHGGSHARAAERRAR